MHWFVVFGRFLVGFLHNGIHKSFGVLLPHLSLEFNSTLSELGWVAGLYAGLTGLLGKVLIISNPVTFIIMVDLKKEDKHDQYNTPMITNLIRYCIIYKT